MKIKEEFEKKWIMVLKFYREIKKIIKLQIENFFEEFKLNFKNYFESIFDEKEIRNFENFQNGFEFVKNNYEELNDKNNKNENLVDVFKNINFLNNSIFDLENIFSNLQNNFNRITKCKLNLNYNKKAILRHINLKSTSFINLKKNDEEEEENDDLEESNLFLETLTGFMKNTLDEKNFGDLKKKQFSFENKNFEDENGNNFDIDKNKNTANFNLSFENKKNTFKKIDINLNEKIDYNNFKFEKNIYEEKKNNLENPEKNDISFQKECKKFLSVKKPLIINSIERAKFKSTYFNKNFSKNNKKLDIEKRKSFLSVEKTTYRSKRSILRSNSILKKINTLKNLSEIEKKNQSKRNSLLNINKNKSHYEFSEKKRENQIIDNSNKNMNLNFQNKLKKRKKSHLFYKNSRRSSRKSSPLIKKKSHHEKKIAKFSNCFLDKIQLEKIIKSVLQNYNNINRIDFLNNTFDCPVLETIDEYFKNKIDNYFTIDLRRNNLKIKKNTKMLVKKLQKKNVIIMI